MDSHTFVHDRRAFGLNHYEVVHCVNMNIMCILHPFYLARNSTLVQSSCEIVVYCLVHDSCSCLGICLFHMVIFRPEHHYVKCHLKGHKVVTR